MDSLKIALKIFLERKGKKLTDKDNIFIDANKTIMDSELMELHKKSVEDVIIKGRKLFDKHIVDTIFQILVRHNLTTTDVKEVMDIYKEQLIKSIKREGSEGQENFADFLKDKLKDSIKTKVVKIEANSIEEVRQKITEIVGEKNAEKVMKDIEKEMCNEKDKGERISTSDLFASVLDHAECGKCGSYHREAENKDGDTVKVGESIADDFMVSNEITEGKLDNLKDCMTILNDFINRLESKKIMFS